MTLAHVEVEKNIKTAAEKVNSFFKKKEEVEVFKNLTIFEQIKEIESDLDLIFHCL